MKTKIKYKIKKLLPDRIIYLYIIIKLIPDYLRAKKEIKKKKKKISVVHGVVDSDYVEKLKF